MRKEWINLHTSFNMYTVANNRLINNKIAKENEDEHERPEVRT